MATENGSKLILFGLLAIVGIFIVTTNYTRKHGPYTLFRRSYVLQPIVNTSPVWPPKPLGLLLTTPPPVRFVDLNPINNSNHVFTSDSLPTNKELIPSIANGYVGTTLYSAAIYVSGVFNGGHLKSHRARIPSSLLASISVSTTEEVSHRYTLDTLTGTFHHVITEKAINGWQIQQRIYAHRVQRNLLISEVTATSSDEDKLSFTVQNNLGDSSEDIQFQREECSSDCQLMSGVTNEAENPSTKKINIAMMWNSKSNKLQFTLPKGTVRQLMFVTAIATNLDSDDPKDSVKQAMEEAVQIHKEEPIALWRSHVSAWKELWDDGSIDVDGDDSLAKAIYGSLYYIISSIRADWPYGLSPGGLASDAYLGHTFWDQETWMYPNLLLLHQSLAQSALVYRYERLDSARQRAKLNSYEGAMFPWESSFSGFEVCPEPNPYSKYEHHITGDVGFAMQQYWLATHDSKWFQKFGANMTRDIADFWASRAVFSSTRKKYVINYVQGPDEYYYNVNNSVYTNAIARINLEFAYSVLPTFGQTPKPQWKDIAENMFIPFNTEVQYHPEFDGYTVNETVKQADVILLGFPLMVSMDAAVRKNDLLLYRGCTNPNGPAMTKSMFAVGWIECGMFESAAEDFKEGYANVREPFKVWTETPGGGAVNFITGAGGFLQSVLFGYGGIRLRNDRLEINPRLPPTVHNMALHGVTYLGNKLAVTLLENHTMTIVLLRRISPFEIILLTVAASQRQYELIIGQQRNIPQGLAYFSSVP